MSLLKNWTVPIRLKIVALLAGALTVSMVFYLYLGRTLIIEDKASYIYDYSLTRIKASADAFDHRLSRVFVIAEAMGNLVDAGASGIAGPALSDYFSKHAPSALVGGMAILRPDATGKLTPIATFGTQGAQSVRLATENGWRTQDYQEKPILIGPAVDGLLPVGGRIFDKADRPLAFVAVLQPKSDEAGQAKLVVDLPPDHELHAGVRDASGRLIERKGSEDLQLEAAGKAKQLDTLLTRLIADQAQSGVKDITIDGKTYITAYHRFRAGSLLVTGLISKDMAFAAAESLARRSILLGGSILLLATGLTLIFVRRLTRGIRQMWDATQRVAQGDFSCRVSIVSSSQDEITGLANSFNVMAAKIDELMLQTAAKARMEKELEMAQEVQRKFFPTEDFRHEGLQLAGHARPASECAGDWWQYRRIDDRVFLIMGDVTGHGVSAALVTAAVHGAFSIAMEDLSKNLPSESALLPVLNTMNAAVIAASGGASAMTAFAAEIDLKKGTMTYVNASHRMPYHCRIDGSGQKKVKPLLGPSAPALGMEPSLACELASESLKEGDVLFLFTDGLLECENDTGLRLNKKELVTQIGALAESTRSDARQICDEVEKMSRAFFGNRYNNLSDDVTIAVAAVPKSRPLS